MKTVAKVFLFYFFVVIVIPSAVVLLSDIHAGKEEKGGDEKSVSVSSYIAKTDEVINMDMEEYLKGVVAAEMPASFEEEALKAQAVAARSYLLARMEGYEKNGYPEEHKGAATCSNPAHCQAWVSDDDLKKKWGNSYKENMDKISKSVDETKGLVMRYNGELVRAVFHSTSSGNTESAKDVWGYDVPYLESVKSMGDELSPRYVENITMSIDDFKKTVQQFDPSAVFAENGNLTDEVLRSESGGIKSITLGGVKMTGAQFRSIFSLNSTNATLTKDGENVVIHTLGNGHGVGMSQYGANYLAGQGKSFKEILSLYYTDCQIEPF